MKRRLFYIIAFVLIMALVSAVAVFAEREEVKDEELNVWTWGIYCPDFATESFQEKYGIKVNCTFYHGNEELWSKIQAGHEGLDIIQPSNHMIQRFANAGLLSPIDIKKIPNYAGLSEGFKKADYNTVDGKQYSVPYTYGIMGVAYRTDKIKEPPTSWGALWDPRYKGKITFSRNPVDACFGVALYLGMDIAKLDEDIDSKLVKIKEKMREQNPLLLKRLESLEEMKNLLASGEVWMTSADDGMIHKMQLDGQPVEFVVPKEGSAAWIDQFCIMSDAPHKDAAYLWIDHMLSPEIASQMIKKMGYMVVNAKAAENLPADMAQIMKYTDAETQRLSPYPTLKPETSEKMVKAYQDVRGE
ncbi:MAG: spermidine/putrescine ABC transporter substrate-binding protein [Spirochaetes bacterium]|nr:spermidine/putrescine ABC transporter substrate-binding protein [Spirochaetota bacterium]